MEERLGADAEPAWMLESQLAQDGGGEPLLPLAAGLASLSEEALRAHGLPPLLHLELQSYRI